MSQFDDDDDSDHEFEPNFDETAELERLERQVRELLTETARLEAQLDQVHAMARENAEELARLHAEVDELARKMTELRRKIHRDRWINLLGPLVGMFFGALSVYMWMR